LARHNERKKLASLARFNTIYW